jgi:hypothetical protein
MVTPSLFLQVQGNTPLNRIWRFLIVHQEYDHSMKDIAQHAQVGYTTLKALWKGLVRHRFVVQTRMVGKAKMYKLNTAHPAVKKFIDFYWAVVDSEVDKQRKVMVEM